MDSCRAEPCVRNAGFNRLFACDRRFSINCALLEHSKLPSASLYCLLGQVRWQSHSLSRTHWSWIYALLSCIKSSIELKVSDQLAYPLTFHRLHYLAWADWNRFTSLRRNETFGRKKLSSSWKVRGTDAASQVSAVSKLFTLEFELYATEKDSFGFWRLNGEAFPDPSNPSLLVVFRRFNRIVRRKFGIAYSKLLAVSLFFFTCQTWRNMWLKWREKKS